MRDSPRDAFLSAIASRSAPQTRGWRKWDSNFWSLSRGCRLVFRGRSGRRSSALRLGPIVSANTAAISRVTLAAIASEPGKVDDIFRL
jgi:hypothetical protein